MFCPQCGRRARPGDRFCSRCGARLISPNQTDLEKKPDPASANAPLADTPKKNAEPFSESAERQNRKPGPPPRRSRPRASSREKESLDEWVKWYLSGANEKRSEDLEQTEDSSDYPESSETLRVGLIQRISGSARLIGAKKRLLLGIRKLPKVFRRVRERAGVYRLIARGRVKTDGARLVFAVREGAERLGERVRVTAKRLYHSARATVNRASARMALRRRASGIGDIQPETPEDVAPVAPAEAQDENAFHEEDKPNRATDALYLETAEDEQTDSFADEWAETPGEEETFLERHLRAAIATGLLAVFAVFILAWCRVSAPGQRLFAQLGLGGAPGYIILGDECMEAGNYTRAVEHFYKALTKRTDYDTAIRLANAYRKTGDAARETSALLLCVDRFEEHIEPYRRLKELYPSPTDRPDAVTDALLKGVSIFSDITIAY